MSTASPIRPSVPHVAVVGCGYWGRNLVRNYYALGALAAVVDASATGRAAALELAPGIEVTDAPLVSDSIVLASPVSALTELGAFRQGLFHLQDPASTLVTMYADIPRGARVADLCAAPGGKSVELSRRADIVFASDVSFGRLRRVRENIARMELATVLPYVADARRRRSAMPPSASNTRRWATLTVRSLTS